MAKLASLKGNGEIEEGSENTLVVIARKGFKEEEKFILVDSQDQLYTYTKSEMLRLMKEGKQFIGIHLIRDVPVLHSECNIGIY